MDNHFEKRVNWSSAAADLKLERKKTNGLMEFHPRTRFLCPKREAYKRLGSTELFSIYRAFVEFLISKVHHFVLYSKIVEMKEWGMIEDL